MFKDRRRGACSGCHRMAETSTNPAESMFTDYGYDAVAWPRNGELPRSRVAARSISGLCERQNRTTPSTRREVLLRTFRTPSLRNVAIRDSFGHNGVYKHLREAVAFYNLRAVAPERVYPPRPVSSTTFRTEVSPQRQHLLPDLQPARGSAGRP